MPWKKGQSGNAGGRPKIVKEITELARLHAPQAFERICDLVRSDDERVALAAANSVVDRAYGKPAQAHTVLADGNLTLANITVNFVKPQATAVIMFLLTNNRLGLCPHREAEEACG